MMVALVPAGASAHIRWFIDDEARYPPRWSRLFSLDAALVLVVTLVLLAGLLLTRRMLGTNDFPNPHVLRYMEPSATALLAVHTGISLIYFASQVQLFVPTLGLGSGLIAAALVLCQIVVSISLISGLLDRAGALLLALVWLLGFAVFPAWKMVDQSLYVGISLCLFVLGRTIPPPSIARELLPLAQYERHSVAALRVLAGVSIAFVGFSEKILAPDAGAEFLATYPRFNVLRELLGWDWWTDERFVIAAGVAEASVGLLLISGVLTRVVILALLAPFNVTVAFLPPIELLGHLPIFGAMYVLLLYGSGIEPHVHEQLLDPALEQEHSAMDPAPGSP